jgi:16S rRNA (adenine1518-N6/adenine1519-N6)-dimethyltransferase
MNRSAGRPKRSLGQNFLVDGNLQRKIVEALAPQPSDEILEVGPGTGALTRHIAGKCRRLILVELDEALAGALAEDYGERPDVRVLSLDILTLTLGEVSEDVARMKVVGNIPYNITTPILFHLLGRPRPGEILLMVQKEVAERILASPGTSAYGALSVGIRSVATVERILTVPASAFRPRPKVDSAVVRIRPIRPEPLTAEEEKVLRTLTRALFQWRRKQTQSILRGHPELGLSRQELQRLEGETGFDLRRRPETFSPAELLRLSKALESAA